MKNVSALFLSLLMAGAPAFGAPQETVKFTPTIKIYECPQSFVYRSECRAQEKQLEAQKLVLDLQVLSNRMGHWSLQLSDPVPSSYYVIVVRGKNGNHYDYSVSTETGIPGSPTPFVNERVEFSDAAIPFSFGVSSATLEKDGKKYITEIRLKDFHGKPVPPYRK